MREWLFPAPHSTGHPVRPRSVPGMIRDSIPELGERIDMRIRTAMASGQSQIQCAVVSRDMNYIHDGHPYASTAFRREG
jgi:hypothetical protein